MLPVSKAFDKVDSLPRGIQLFKGRLRKDPHLSAEADTFPTGEKSSCARSNKKLCAEMINHWYQHAFMLTNNWIDNLCIFAK